MKKLAVCLCLITNRASFAGQLGSEVPWIFDPTPSGELVLNNNDYQGTFAGNPNHFHLNREGIQSIVSTEVVIPTRPSGGVTEYAVTLGGRFAADEDGPIELLDGPFRVQLGFGTGTEFVEANGVIADLVFDNPSNVNPAIEDYRFFPFDQIPLLTFFDHQGDALLFQGSSFDGLQGRYREFSDPGMLQLPLDLPDIPESVREYYSAEALEGLSADDNPFTIRIISVPEPSTALLLSMATIVLGASVGGRNRKRIS